mmetsp:Transcript_2890/g.4922  ORF Transcript_2890/g.4922 Transcript_2890/m.4922 type:complete len:81 (+) Transcript_2890:718-960(+)
MQRFNIPEEEEEASKQGAPKEQGRRLVKCKHYPNCNYSDEECPYFHPSEDCKYFPACTNGEKCLFIHPEVICKFGVNCQR